MATKSDKVRLVLATGVLVMSSYFLISHFQSTHRGEPKNYFYDLSEGELFIAPQSAVPPIQGINDEVMDGVRAIVITMDGDCENEASRKVAYLEKYSPELKRQFESFRRRDTEGTAPIQTLSRSQAKAHQFVKRLEDAKWYPINSRTGVVITEGWRVKGPNGLIPTVCVP